MDKNTSARRRLAPGQAGTGMSRIHQFLSFIVLMAVTAGCASPPKTVATSDADHLAAPPATPVVTPAAPAPVVTATAPEDLAQKWGIEITGLLLSANGHMVDFRYRVLDPDKAAALSDPKAKPYLLDPATGAKLLVPRTPKLGPLRQSALKPEAGRVYFVLFGNMGMQVKAGSKVSVVIGDCRIDNLTVK